MAQPDNSGAVAIFAPREADGAALAGVVEAAGYACVVHADPRALAEALSSQPPGAPLCLLVAEEGADRQLAELLAGALEAQPAWSSLPVLLLVSDAERPPPGWQALQGGRTPVQAMLLERPVRPAVLAAALDTQAALRRRQLEAGELLGRLAEAERRQSFLLGEIRHRTRNTLAVLQALFRLTARNYGDVESFVEAFASRLRSLSDAHLRLAEEGSGSSRLQDIFRQHVTPYCTDPAQLVLEGPDREVTGRTAFELAMAANELATNAAKYGALSVAEGQLLVSWQETGDGGLELTWREAGGPPVEEPAERRVGSQLIAAVGREAGAASRSEFRPDGLVWRLSLPADCLEPAPR